MQSILEHFHYLKKPIIPLSPDFPFVICKLNCSKDSKYLCKFRVLVNDLEKRVNYLAWG